MPARNATPGPSTLSQQPDILQPHTSKKRGVSDHTADEGPRSKKHRKDLEVTDIDDKSAAVNLSVGSKDNKKKRRKKKKKSPLTVPEIDQDRLILHTGSRAPASSSLASSTTLSQASVSPPVLAAPLAIVSSHSEPLTAIGEGSDNPPFSFTNKGKGRAVSEGPDNTLSRSVVGSPQERDTMKAAQTKIAELTAQLESQKQRLTRHEDNLSHLQQSLTCEICLDLLYKPYALNPCGHVVCYMCLVRWFTNIQGGPVNPNVEPPTTQEDVHRLLTGQAATRGVFLRNRKTCPLCRAAMVERPVEIWSVKSMVANLVKSKLADLPSSPPPSATETPGARSKQSTSHNDPWRNIFRKSRVHAIDEPFRPPVQFYPPPPDHHEGEGDEAWGMQDMGMYDAEDGGIYRCLDCMHEIWGGLCTHCQREYAGHARFDRDDDDDDDDVGEEGENFLGRRLRQIRAHNGHWGLEIEAIDDHEEDDDDIDADEYFGWGPAPYWREMGLSDDESLSGEDLDEGESSEGGWSGDEEDHERALFDALREAREEGGIAHIEPVEEEEEQDHEPYHSGSASGTDSDVHERPNSDDEEEYEDSFIDDEEEDGAADHNRRARQHRSRGHSVIDPVDSEDEDGSEGGHTVLDVLDQNDTDEESLDARAVARRLGRGMRPGGGGVEYGTDMDSPFRGLRGHSIVDDSDDDEEDSDEEDGYGTDMDSPFQGQRGRHDYGHRIYVDDDDDDDDDEDEEEEEVRPRRYRAGLRQQPPLEFTSDSDY